MKIYKLLPVLLMVISLGLTSCTDWLDIKPESELILDEYWQTESQAQEVVIACYRKLTEFENMRRMMVWGELRSDNLMATSLIMADKDKTLGLSKILNVDISPTNVYCKWGSMYQVINYCNTFLHYAPGVMAKDVNYTLADYQSMKAEVLTIRALCYFYLVRTFRDIPWVETPSIDDSQNFNVKQLPEKQVLDSIVSNLKTAENYARSEYGKNMYNKGRITKSAVEALLADVYLWRQDYEACVSTANKVLSDATLKLESADDMFLNVFYNGNSTESIFELQFSDDGVKNEACQAWYGTGSDMIGDLCLPPFVASGTMSPFNRTQPIESQDDIRGKLFFREPSSTGQYLIFKYAGAIVEEVTTEKGTSLNYYYRSNTPNWIVYRLSDVMLMKAEALAQLNRSVDDRLEALKMVNQSYLRSNPGSDSLQIENYPEIADLQSLVLRERHRELLFEGKRWFDLMRIVRRTNSASELLQYVGPKLTGEGNQYSKMSVIDALYMPISQSELEANPLLHQNPFYNISSTGSSK